MKLDYEQEIQCLCDVVSQSTYDDFVSKLSFNNVIIEEKQSILDFDYEHLTATINKSDNDCYLTGVYDCYDDDGQWVDTLYKNIVRFKN